MKLVNSNKEQLNYGEIMTLYHENFVANTDGPDKDLTTWLTRIAKMIITLRAEGEVLGNTFFLYKRGTGEDSDKAMGWVMSVDTVSNRIADCVEMLNRLVNMGVSNLIFAYKDPALTHMLKKIFSKVRTAEDTLTIQKNDKQIIVHMHLSGGENV